MDYSIFYKEELKFSSKPLNKNTKYDVFISVYNASQRVQKVFENIDASNKFWLILPEYNFSIDELPNKDTFICEGNDEGLQIKSFFRSLKNIDIKSTSLGIDITGFMRPQLAFLLKYLFTNGVKKVDLFYAEPMQYSKQENTKFSDGNVTDVRQMVGFEGIHDNYDTKKDLLVIGAGYDYDLIRSVSNTKEHARIKHLIGFPSLRPDMYQENLIKSANAFEGNTSKQQMFAPANDPFMTAEVLRDTIINGNEEFTNIYLCPLSTKPQTVGFILFYLKELQDKKASMIFPFFEQYDKSTSVGVHKVWQYTVEF